MKRTADPLRQRVDGAGARDIVRACDASSEADGDFGPQRLQHFKPSLRAYDFHDAADALVLTACKRLVQHHAYLA